MKTKKEILEWWINLGEKIKDTNDYIDFWQKIDQNSIYIIEKQKGTGERQEHILTLMKKGWKYPIRLYFYNLECYKIEGF